MNKIDPSDALQEEIRRLEMRRAEELSELRLQVHETYENLKPSNIIRNTLMSVTETPDIRGNFLNATLGLVSGFVTRKVLIGATHNPIKKLLGIILQYGVSNIVSRKGDVIRKSGAEALRTAADKTREYYTDFRNRHNGNGIH